MYIVISTSEVEVRLNAAMKISLHTSARFIYLVKDLIQELTNFTQAQSGIVYVSFADRFICFSDTKESSVRIAEYAKQLYALIGVAPTVKVFNNVRDLRSETNEYR